MIKKTKDTINAVCFMLLLLAPLSALASPARESYLEEKSYLLATTFDYQLISSDMNDNSLETDDRKYNIDAALGWFWNRSFAMGFKIGYGDTRNAARYTAGSSPFISTSKLMRLGFFMRNYFRLSRILKFYIETNMVTGFGNTKFKDSTPVTGFEDPGKHFTFEVGFRPGIVFFFNSSLAVEVSAAFFGLTYNRIKMTDSATSVTTIDKNTTVDFAVNLDQVRVQLGIAWYL